MRLEDEVPYSPTEEEIAAAASRIRENWSEEEMYRRAGLIREPVEVLVVHAGRLDELVR